MRLVFVKAIKRLFDFFSALLLFIILSPVFVVICLLIRIKLGTPVFFVQTRSGRKQKPFKIIKFRTMTNQTDENGNLLPDEMRQTKFGNLLRSSSLDELPELLSIIKGDMSVFGPRPLPPSYDSFYSEREKKRFEVRGGLLPPDTIDSSAYISWDRQLEYEAAYAENLSILNDIKILFATLRMLSKRNATGYGKYIRKPLNEERASWNIRYL